MLPYTLHAIILLNEDTQKYVDNVIKQFEEDSQRFNDCPIVYPPLPPPGSPKEDYFRPNVPVNSKTAHPPPGNPRAFDLR